MKSKVRTAQLPLNCLRLMVFVLIAAASHVIQAQTVWTGPIISYSQPAPDPTQPANQDRITDNVWITRGALEGIFNAAKGETNFTDYYSPADTEWADGYATNYASLSFTDWESWAKGIHGGPPGTIGVNAVVHLISDNIYVDITFTSWGVRQGGFSYERSSPAVVLPPPTVSITNLANADVFAAPANVAISANASVSGGTVTDVEFFANGTSLGSITSAPFTLTASNLTAGSYGLTAVATAGGLSATSSVVNITVVSPIAVSSSGAAITTGQFAFDYSANPGLKYIVQRSTDLTNWISVATNTATSNPVHFTDNFTSSGSLFYRVARLPNP